MQRNAPICCKIYFICRPYLSKETQTHRFLGCLLRHLDVLTLSVLQKKIVIVVFAVMWEGFNCKFEIIYTVSWGGGGKRYSTG
jgi:hypothetical protein